MKIEDKFYLDNNTFVAVFNNQIEENGDRFNYEIEYHEDEGEWIAVKVYDYDVIEVDDLSELPDCMLQMAKNAKSEIDIDILKN